MESAEKFDTKRIDRLAKNVATFLLEIRDSLEEAIAKTSADRLKILADLREFAISLPPEDRGRLLSLLTLKVKDAVSASSFENRERVAAVTVSPTGCHLGAQDGFGVKVTAGNISATGCVTGDTNGVTGGGIIVEGRC